MIERQILLASIWSRIFGVVCTPRLNAYASAESFVGAAESYRASVVGFDSSCFVFSCAVDRVGPHVQELDLLRSSLSDCVISARLGVELTQLIGHPKESFGL